VTGHLLELLPDEAATLAAAARILAERTIGSVHAVSLRAGAGHVRLVAHLQSGVELELRDVEIGERAGPDLAASVRVHNARRSARP
jgi:hypothetical protein